MKENEPSFDKLLDLGIQLEREAVRQTLKDVKLLMGRMGPQFRTIALNVLEEINERLKKLWHED